MSSYFESDTALGARDPATTEADKNSVFVKLTFCSDTHCSSPQNLANGGWQVLSVPEGGRSTWSRGTVTPVLRIHRSRKLDWLSAMPTTSGFVKFKVLVPTGGFSHQGTNKILRILRPQLTIGHCGLLTPVYQQANISHHTGI